VLVNAKIVERPRRLAEWEPWAIYRTKDDPTRVEPQRFISIGDVLIWAMPDFTAEDRIVDGMWERARRHRAVILDLRDNPGGYTSTLNRMLANAMDRDIKAYDLVERKGPTPELVKSRKGNAFTGELTVLVDSNSGSGAELFARIVQLEKRGVVIGDRSAGAVMAGRLHEGESRHLFYAFVITEADVVMSDGKSLERVGVVPDETVLPTAADLAAGRDPVLAHAAARLGLTLDATAAAKILEKKGG
jgi:carboxyl-terminal processing protease